jgi:hypothetical protein
MKWAMVVILADGLLFASFAAGVYTYRASRPDEKSFTMKGYVTHACGCLSYPPIRAMTAP